MQPSEEGKRYWQNWDNGEASKRIDAYWVQSENSWREMLVKQLKRNFKPGDSILEVGCGSGLIYHKMREHGLVDARTYRGGDISQEMLKLARGRSPEVDFRTLDIFKIDLPDASQDNVINIHVMQHLPGYEQPVRELLRVARHKLFIACWFTTGLDDTIQFSEPSSDWDNQRFQNNNYSLPKFLAFIFANAPRKIWDLKAHHFEGINYGITVCFRENDDASMAASQPAAAAQAGTPFAAYPSPVRENLAALQGLLARIA